MSLKLNNKRQTRGFTLIEATISLTLLLIVLALSLTFLFSMKNFSQQQEMAASPRQAARRAIEYLSYYARGASDMNNAGASASPNAIMMFYDAYGTTTPVQASYNNLTSNSYGDPGTDIITMAIPSSNLLIPISGWPGGQHAATLTFEYSDGCPDSAQCMTNFKAVTGYDPSTGHSSVLTLVDDDGSWAFYQITDYKETKNKNCCSGNVGNIEVNHSHGLSDNDIDPPGGQPTLHNPKLATVTFSSFRVKNDQLQQKTGVFDPNNPDSGFYTLMDDVEDFQVAYIYNDGTIWNTAAQTLTTPGTIPTQAGTGEDGGVPTARDITNVIGLRFTIVTRSAPLPVTLMKINTGSASVGGPPPKGFYRPRAEDHAKSTTPDNRYHYRLTSTIMIRNRMLGG